MNHVMAKLTICDHAGSCFSGEGFIVAITRETPKAVENPMAGAPKGTRTSAQTFVITNRRNTTKSIVIPIALIALFMGIGYSVTSGLSSGWFSIDHLP